MRQFKRLGIDLLATGGTDVRVRVSLGDITSGFLDEKIAGAVSGKITKAIANAGFNEVLELDVDESNIDHNILANYDINQHRNLDDAQTTAINLWSGTKIQTELDGKINAIPNPVADNRLTKTIGLDGNDLEQTGIAVDDSDNLTGINDLTMAGNLTVNGTQTIINTTDLEVTDGNITVNKGGTLASANLQTAGLTVEMTDATDAAWGFDSTITSKFKLGEVGDEREVVTTTHSQAISNKTINADNNTISDLEVDNLKTGVLTTDLNNVVDDTKLPSSKAVKDYVAQEIATKDEASEIAFDPSSSTLTSLNVQDAIDEADTKAESHINASDNVHGIGATADVVGTDTAQTLTNKTIQGASIETPARLDTKQDTEANLVTYALTATNGQLCFATDTKVMYQVIDTELEELTGTATAVKSEITQNGHAFVTLDSIYNDGVSWKKALANNSDTLGTHVVVEVIDGNNFVMSQVGRHVISGHGLILGEFYFVSDTVAGVLSTTEGVNFSNPLLFVDTANTVVCVPYRPSFIDNTVVTQQIINLNNNSINQDVTNFLINPVGFRAFKSQVEVEIDATANVYEHLVIEGIWNGSNWDLTIDSIGDSGVSFDMTNAGQLQYNSPNFAGFNSGKVSFKYNVMIRGL